MDVLKKQMSPFEKKMWYFGLPLSMALFLGIFFMPTPVGLTYSGKISLAVFASAITLWITNSIPNYVVALFGIGSLAIFGGWTEAEALGVFGYEVIWLMVAAFIITAGMEKSGLARRLALFLISKFGKTTRMLIGSLMAANFLIAFVVPSTTARAAIMFPIVMLVAEAYGLHKEGACKNTGKLLTLTGMNANHLSTGAILTATAPQIVAVQLIRDFSGETISWSQWFVGAAPLAIITMIIAYFVGFMLFKPNDNSDATEGVKRLKDEYEKLGKITIIEKKAIVIFAITVALWALDKFHFQLFGFQISLVMVAVFSAAVFMMPYFGIIEWKEAKIPWELMIFSAGCYATGTAINKTGVSEWALGGLFDKLGVENMSFVTLFAVVMFISSFSHMVFTSKTVRTMILIPTVIALAESAGVNPVTLALPAAFTIADCFTLPPQSKVNLIYLSSGYFTVLDQLKYGLIVGFIKWGVLVAFGLTFYRAIGIVV